MTPAEEMLSVVSRLSGVRVLVVGDLMLDRFVYGDVDRISPEGPIPVLRTRRESRMPGGCGNVLANLHGLGAKGRVLAVIGDDAEGALLKDLVRESGDDGSFLLKRPERPTTIKTRFLAGHQQLLRVDQERDGWLSEEAKAELHRAVETLVLVHDVVILSDYGKGVLTPGLTRRVISLAREAGIPVLVDPKGSDYTKYSGADLVTPNRKELSEAAKAAPVATDEEVAEAAKQVLRESGIRAMVATRSKDGMTILERGGEREEFCAPVHLRTRAREVFDVSGAGDTVIATLAACLGAGASLRMAASLANIAAGIVVGKVGTAAVRAAELGEEIKAGENHCALESHEKPLFCARVLGWEEAREEVERWRARGLRIGFTNGCFDIVHAGHVNYLGRARAECDRLVLGLNSDASVRLLKGPSRPVNDQAARATVLGALGAVDMVVFFGAEKEGEDNTAAALIKTLKPDIYFKGADYTLDRIPEAGIVASYGGKMRLVPLTKGHSTTSLLAKIAGEEAA